MKEKMVSIIIPVYNSELSISKSLDSVFMQDVLEKEIICIDDGSTDSSIDIIRDYQKNHPEIVLLQQENMGAGAARNKGLKYASGRYVSFLDSDDEYYDSLALKNMINAAVKTGLHICAGVCMNEKGGKITELSQFAYLDASFNQDGIAEVSFFDYQQDYAYVGCIYERDFLVKNQLFFPNYRRYQDPPFLARVLLSAKKIAVTGDRLYLVHEHTGYIKRSFLQVCDNLRGIRDNIVLACDNKLQILCQNSVDRLDNGFFGMVKTSIEDGNIEAVKLVIDIQSVLENSPNGEKKKLKLYNWIEERLVGAGLSGECRYIFPFDHIVYNSKIILYGAGLVGREMKAVIGYTQYCEIVHWVDKRFEEDSLKDLGVVSPDVIRNSKVQIVLVAVERSELYEEIKNNLIEEYDLNEDCIVGPIKKRMEANNKDSNSI